MEQEDFNIREHQLTSKERDFENALRPLSFEDFSGQDKVVENLLLTAWRRRYILILYQQEII